MSPRQLPVLRTQDGVRETGRLRIPCGLTEACDGRDIPELVLASASAEGKRLLKQARLVGRLRANPLYPKEVRPGRALNLTAVHILNLCTSCICAHRPQAQVACRDEKCFGLGYLGGDTVM